MARTHVELLHEISIIVIATSGLAAASRLGSNDALAAAPLHSVGVCGKSLDVATPTDREHHFMLRNEVGHFEVFGLGASNHCAARVAKLLLQFNGVLTNDVKDQALVRQDRLEAVDLINKFREF